MHHRIHEPRETDGHQADEEAPSSRLREDGLEGIGRRHGEQPVTGARVAIEPRRGPCRESRGDAQRELLAVDGATAEERHALLVRQKRAEKVLRFEHSMAMPPRELTRGLDDA